MWPDELFILQQRNGIVIYSGETALYLHGLTDREYSSVCVTVPQGYNASHLRKSVMRDIGVRVQTSGTGDPTAKAAIENVMIMEAIQKGNLESVTSELDEQVVIKYQKEVVTIQNMREDHQILRNQFF